MKMYQDYRLMKMKPEPIDEATAMRCLGCGGKIGSELLSQVLDELDLPPNENVIIGLEEPDDAAIVRTTNDQVTLTTDFFAAPFDDPYLVGRIAALNSASDCFAMGARPTSALAIVQIPVGHPRAQLQVMRELMAGSAEELSRMGAAMVGGHSIEGPRTMIGFTMVGTQVTQPKIKGDLQVGDQLVLTKPLGSGVMLAALMQSKLGGNDYVQLIETMLQSNQVALKLIDKFSIAAITDVTGF
jgi:selenide,water dikinase